MKYLIRQLEVDRDLGLYFDRLPIQIIGLIFPLADGLHRSTPEYALSANYLYIRDPAVPADGGLQQD